MAPRAENPNSLSGPTGPSLLDQSKATPADINPEIFKSRNPERQPTEGTVSSDYLKRTREEDPWPAESSCAPTTNPARKQQTVTLSDCRITTNHEHLITNQIFEMEVKVQTTNGASPNPIAFRVLCQTDDGPKKDQSQSIKAKLDEDGVTAKGAGPLLPPRGKVAYGAKVRYSVVAEHLSTGTKAHSGEVEVVGDKPPKVLAIWSIASRHFGFGTSFLLPSIAEEIQKLKSLLAEHPGAAISIFDHAGANAIHESNDGRMAYALYCLLTRNTEGWIELSKPSEGDQWGIVAQQVILSCLTKESGQPYYRGPIDANKNTEFENAIESYNRDLKLKADKHVEQRTLQRMFADYMDTIAEIRLAPEDFVGNPNDPIAQWACVGCGQMNPLIKKPKNGEPEQDEKQGVDSVSDSYLDPNRRATVLLFPSTTKGAGKIRFPCHERSRDRKPCPVASAQDLHSDTTVNGSNGFKCKFYQEIAEGETVNSNPEGEIVDAWFENFNGNPLSPIPLGVPLKLIIKTKNLIGESIHIDLASIPATFSTIDGIPFPRSRDSRYKIYNHNTAFYLIANR